MYLEHFGLKELPFRLGPDPDFLYLSKNHARAKSYMESTIWFTDGFVIITGEVGCGKTTLIETVISELDTNVIVAQISQTQLSPKEFLQALLVQFGFSPFQMEKIELLSTLTQFLVSQFAAGRKVLLIVDEAQNLSSRVLEEIRLLSGVETTKDKVLRIILAGQPELSQKLDAPEAVQLMQRVRLRFHLTELSPDETRSYILHRLAVAGSRGEPLLFDEETFAPLYAYSRGVPRLVNTLCDSALMIAFARNQPRVALEDIETAVDELGRDKFQTRAPRRRQSDAPRAAPADDDPILARLVIIHEDGTIVERELRAGRLAIGREPDNDLQIDGKFISRHHCQITTTGRGSMLEDLDSTNGVYVKSKRTRRHSLNDGDVIAIGNHEIIYMDERDTAGRGEGEETAAAGTA
jgi:type II secretory pathway predicted ATPase ExeA